MKHIKPRLLKKAFSGISGFVILFFLAVFAHVWLSFISDKKDDNLKKEKFSVSDLCIDFLDVGSADCALIHNDKNLIMIDAGLINSNLSVPDYIKNEIFDKRNIKRIDLMVLTHPHADHYGQMSKVLDKFETSRFITSKSPVSKTDNSGYEKLLKKIKEKNLKIEYAKPRTCFNIGDIKINILGPIRKDENNINNNSVVLKLEYNGISTLFTGDAEKEEEKDLIESGQNLKSHILKAPHHGSSTSSSFKFLKEVNPEKYIISAHDKKNNFYPHHKVSNSLNALGIPYAKTQDEGTIRVIIDKNGNYHIPCMENKENKKKAA